MNERIKELIAQATKRYEPDWNGAPAYEDFNKEKFAELIVKECIKTIEYRTPGQIGKIGVGWLNGYDDGLKTGAWLLKKHFGVKE